MTTLFFLSYVAMWVLLVVVGVLLLLLYRHFGLLTLGTEEGVQRDGLPVGESAPVIHGVTAEGAATQWHPDPGRQHLVLFATPDCEPCAKVLPVVDKLVRHRLDLMVTAIVPGPRMGAMRLVEKFQPAFPCLADEDRSGFDRYRVRVTPYAFVVGADGRILAKGLCSDPWRLRALLATGGQHEAAAVLEPTIEVARASARVATEAREG